MAIDKVAEFRRYWKKESLKLYLLLNTTGKDRERLRELLLQLDYYIMCTLPFSVETAEQRLENLVIEIKSKIFLSKS